MLKNETSSYIYKCCESTGICRTFFCTRQKCNFLKEDIVQVFRDGHFSKYEHHSRRIRLQFFVDIFVSYFLRAVCSFVCIGEL